MKIALYIEDGREQIVLTPEGKTETSILGKLHEGQRQLSIHRGGFYACQGGWTRHQQTPDSTILVLDEPRDTVLNDGSFVTYGTVPFVPAQGIEAATAAETVEQGSVHESPVPQGCAQTAPKGAI